MEVLNTVGFNIDVANLVQTSIYIGDNTYTNVYTIFHFYVNDFGIFFSYFMLLFYGVIHGYIYKTKYKNDFHLYVFAFSAFPLIMQFFQDQYASLTSTWIQVILYGLLFYKSKVFQK
jgi:oligosaccharide repeat unit polymerase